MYVGDDKRVQLRVDVPAEEIVIVPRLVGDEYELLSARIDVGVACSALPRPSVPARATKTQSRGDGTPTEAATALLTRSSVSHKRPLDV